MEQLQLVAAQVEVQCPSDMMEQERELVPRCLRQQQQADRDHCGGGDGDDHGDGVECGWHRLWHQH